MDLNEKNIDIKEKDIDDWEIVEKEIKDYSSNSKKSALLPLLNYVHETYPDDKETYFAVSTFYDNNYNFTARTSFDKMIKELTEKLDRASDDQELKNDIIQKFTDLVKEGDKG